MVTKREPAEETYPPGFLEAARLLIRWTAERRAAKLAAQDAAAASRQDG